MDAERRELVRHRAAGYCEYCRLPQSAVPFAPFHVEHIVARQHGGSDDPDNLALACDRCNLHKGPNLSSIDPQGGEMVPLFHPRRHVGEEHFRFRDATLLRRIGGLLSHCCIALVLWGLQAQACFVYNSRCLVRKASGTYFRRGQPSLIG